MTVESPAVSVVLPTFNQAGFLSAALEGVTRQTFTDLEVILIDDGSTDATDEVVERWRVRFEGRLHLIRQSNAGLAAARNAGVSGARGRFMAFLDSDDVWLPRYLERMVGVAEHSEATVVYCGTQMMDESGNDLPQVTDRVVPDRQTYKTLLRTNFLVPSAVLADRTKLPTPGPFDPVFRLCEDWELWLRMTREGAKFTGIPELLVRYRIHQGSLSSDVAGGEAAALAIMDKHFDGATGEPSAWPADKRRGYGGAHRYAAVNRLLVHGDRAAAGEALSRAVACDPELTCDLDLFYTLALGQRPRGQRRVRIDEQVSRAAENLFLLLDQAEPTLVRIPEGNKRARGTAHLALGMIAYRTGDTRAARRHLSRAMVLRPELLRQREPLNQWSRSLLPSRLLHALRAWRSGSPP